MSERVAVVTDSTCDLPPAQLAAEGITMVPLSVFFGDEEFEDALQLTTEAFYARAARDPEPPTTSQPPAGKFLAAFQSLAAEGYTHALCLHLSGRLSGTAGAAAAAAKMQRGLRIEVLDTGSTSWGLGMLALYARSLVREGLGWDALLARVRACLPDTVVYFTVDTLDALRRGGRIGRAAGAIGQALGIRPVLRLYGSQGEIEVERIVTSRRAADRLLIQAVLNRLERRDAVYGVCAVGAADPERSRGLHAALAATGRVFPRLLLGRIGAVIGTHLGPDGAGVAVV